jgi:hypothetical protein
MTLFHPNRRGTQDSDLSRVCFSSYTAVNRTALSSKAQSGSGWCRAVGWMKLHGREVGGLLLKEVAISSHAHIAMWISDGD